MKKLSCLIVEDEPLAIQLLEDYISKTYFLEHRFSTTNPLEGLQKIEKTSFDLIFLDIQMPELNGMDFLKILNNQTKVILTTAYSDFALESYNYGVVDYLLKPISYERFYKSVLKVKDFYDIKLNEIQPELTQPEKEFFFIKSEGKQIKLEFQDILYIEGLRDYVNIKTLKDEWIVLENLKDLETTLPNNFLRIHRSFIVNLNKIESVEGNRIFINNLPIPIGETYKSNFQNWLEKQ